MINWLKNLYYKIFSKKDKVDIELETILTYKDTFADDTVTNIPKEMGNSVNILSEQNRINSLFLNDFNTYLIESSKFERKFNKSWKCDVCGDYKSHLISIKNVTYCNKCIPPERKIYERKITATNHGGSRSYLKKIE